MNKEFSAFLDFSRWASALLVVISHIRHVVLADFGDVQHKTLALKIFYFGTGLGHEAVVIFFIISGMLVGGLTYEKWKKKGIDWSAYFISRTSRIYTVLIPALLIGCALDLLGYAFFNDSSIYTNSSQYSTNSIKDSIVGDISPLVFFGNLFMLENIFVPVLGSNGPLWSLAYEWWYYCLFALMASAHMLHKKSSMFLVTTAILVLFAILPGHLLGYMSIWGLGIISYFYAKSPFRKPYPLISAMLFLSALGLSRLNTHLPLEDYLGLSPLPTTFLFDVMIGLSYSTLLASLYGLRKNFLPFKKTHKLLAEFSYTLYLVHFPLLVLIMAFSHDMLGIRYLAQPNNFGIAVFCGITVLLYLYAFVFYAFTERHTSCVKSWLMRLVSESARK